MPPWGRPQGAGGSVRRRVWERERERGRIQELDSDDDYSYGVGSLGQKRFASDPLQFTGADMTPRPRRSYAYEDSETSGDTDELAEGGEMQLAMRDKEEAMVQRALARIRRAQEKGKKEVKLSPEELAALDRHRKRTQKEEKRRGSDDRRHRDNRIAVPLSQLEPMSRKSNLSRRDENSPPSAPPGMLVEGPDGSLTYAAIGDYNSSQPSSKRSSPASRPHPSTQISEALSRQYLPPTRHFSDDTRPSSSGRSLPHGDSWRPRSRGNSMHSHDPFAYQTFDAEPTPSIPSYYLNASRTGSGTEIQYASRPGSSSRPAGNVYPSTGGSQGVTHSDPTLSRRPTSREAIYVSSEDSSDELGNGVRVEAASSALPRKPVAKKKKGRR